MAQCTLKRPHSNYIQTSIKFYLILLFLLPCLLPLQANGSESEKNRHLIDSLYKASQNMKGDSAQILFLNDYAWGIKNNKPDLSIELMEKSIQLASQKKLDYLKADAIRIQAISYRNLGEDLKAIALNNKVLKIYVQLGYKKGVMVTYNSLGILYKNRHQLDSADYYYSSAISLAKELQNGKAEVQFLLNKTAIYDLQERNHESIKQYLEVLRISTALKDTITISGAYMGLSINYHGLENYALSIENARKALTLEQYLGDSSAIALALGKIGAGYEELDQLDSAFMYCQKYLELSQRIKNIRQQILAHEFLGGIFERKADLQQAMYHFSQSIDLIEQKSTGFAPNEKRRILERLSWVYFSLGKYNAAEKYALEAEVLGKSTPVEYAALTDIYHTLTHIAEKQGKTAAAFSYQKKYIQNRDSFEILQKKKLSLNLQMKYETALKDAQIEKEIYEKEQEKSKFEKAVLTIGFISFLSLVILLFTLQLLRKKKAIESQNQQLAESNQTITHQNKELSEAKQELQKSYEEIEQKNQLIQEYQDKYIKTLNRQLQVKNENGKLEYIDLRDIVYFQKGADVGKNSLKIYTSLGRTYHKKISVKALLEELSDTSFARIDTSTIVNLHFIEEIDIENNTITLEAKVENTELERVESVKKALTIPETGKIGTEFFKKYDHFLLSQA